MEIIAHNIAKSYHRGSSSTAVFSQVNLMLKPGAYVSVVGPSGSGKSTLLHILGLMDTPSSGVITYDCVNMHAATVSKRAEFRARHVGFVFQQFNLLPRLSALQNVVLPRLYVPGSDKGRQAGEDLLVRLGVWNRRNHFPAEMSGGEKQRVAIARALINSPSLILADEPTGSLDHSSASEVLGILEAEVSVGRGLLLVSHNHDVANRASTRLSVNAGHIDAH